MRAPVQSMKSVRSGRSACTARGSVARDSNHRSRSAVSIALGRRFGVTSSGSRSRTGFVGIAPWRAASPSTPEITLRQDLAVVALTCRFMAPTTWSTRGTVTSPSRTWASAGRTCLSRCRDSEPVARCQGRAVTDVGALSQLLDQVCLGRCLGPPEGLNVPRDTVEVSILRPRSVVRRPAPARVGSGVESDSSPRSHRQWRTPHCSDRLGRQLLAAFDPRDDVVGDVAKVLANPGVRRAVLLQTPLVEGLDGDPQVLGDVLSPPITASAWGSSDCDPWLSPVPPAAHQDCAQRCLDNTSEGGTIGRRPTNRSNFSGRGPLCVLPGAVQRVHLATSDRTPDSPARSHTSRGGHNRRSCAATTLT